MLVCICIHILKGCLHSYIHVTCVFFSLPTEAHSLILWMLSYRPDDRPTIANILNHPWMKMTSSSSGSSSSVAKASPPSAHQSPQHQSTISPHHYHYRHHHRAPVPSPQLTRQVAPKPVKASGSPYLTRAAVASSYTPPTNSRSQTSLSPRSDALLSSASLLSVGMSPSSGGSSVSLNSTGSTTSWSGLRSSHGTALNPSSPRIPLMNHRRTRLQAATRRK